MFTYRHEDLSNLTADGLVIEVACVGKLDHRQSTSLESAHPDIVAAHRKAFSQGDIEPGRVIRIARPDRSPGHAFLFPSRVHPNGEVRAEYVDRAVEDLTEQALRIGVKSIAMSRIGGERGIGWSEVKRRLLYSFARVPEIRLVGMLPRQMTDTPVTIFTDGAAEPNPGQGGYGVVLRCGDHSKELSDGFRLTSNHRMELMAAIIGLEALKQTCRVHLHCDSRYVVDMVNTGNLFRIAAKNWASTKTRNLDLWKRFLEVFLLHEVDLLWVKGHAGLDDNERCDQLAAMAMKQSQLNEDVGYARESDTQTRKRKRGERPSKPKKTGDPCRHCGNPLQRREPKKHKADAAYYFAWYLYCENCRRTYHVEEAKVVRQAR